MAIGTLHIDWLSALALKGAIPPDAAVLDLGPQDIIRVERSTMERVARRHRSPAKAILAMDRIYGDGAVPKPDAQATFYSIFGATDYRSLDLTDPRADFALDLNHPLPDIGKFDVVTDFGTSEHVFNIGQSFANIHNLLKSGGVALLTLPSYGYIDHGFYNIHPCAYLDMAKANAYEIVDFSYIDNINTRMARSIDVEPFDFTSLPIQLGDMNDTHAFMKKALMLFYENLQSEETRWALEAIAPPAPLPQPKKSWFGRKQEAPKPAMPNAELPIFVVFDMMFVALRKTERSPEKFALPIQGVYAEMQRQNAARVTGQNGGPNAASAETVHVAVE